MMKVLQPKLVCGTEGKILIDTTNLKSTSSSSTKKRKGENIENLQPQKIIRKDGIYCDPPSAPVKKTTLVDSSTQTDPSWCSDESREIQRVKDMLTSEHPPIEYWKSLAERKGKLLEAAHKEIQNLKDEIECFEEQNKLHEEMLEEAKHLALLVKELTSDEDESSGGQKSHQVDSSASYSSDSLQNENEL